MFSSARAKPPVNIKKMTQIAILIALEIVLNITGLGLIKIPPLAITILHIPVILGGMILGPVAGGILGATFGFLSIWESTTKGVSPMDLAFSPFYSGSPVASIIMALGCRILLGLAAGWVYNFLSKRSLKGFWAPTITALICCILHTSTVLGCLWMLFPSLGVEFKAILATIFSLNFLVETGAAVLFALGFTKVIPHLKKMSK